MWVPWEAAAVIQVTCLYLLIQPQLLISLSLWSHFHLHTHLNCNFISTRHHLLLKPLTQLDWKHSYPQINECRLQVSYIGCQRQQCIIILLTLCLFKHMNSNIFMGKQWHMFVVTWGLDKPLVNSYGIQTTCMPKVVKTSECTSTE